MLHACVDRGDPHHWLICEYVCAYVSQCLRGQPRITVPTQPSSNNTWLIKLPTVFRETWRNGHSCTKKKNVLYVAKLIIRASNST